MFCLLQPLFGGYRRTDLVAFEAQHARKCLRHSFIVIDDKDL